MKASTFSSVNILKVLSNGDCNDNGGGLANTCQPAHVVITIILSTQATTLS